MRNVVVVNASPRVGDGTASQYFAELVLRQFGEAETDQTLMNVRLSIRNRRTEDDFGTLSRADAMVFVFPLYIFCLPGLLTRFLEDYTQFLRRQGKAMTGARVYAVVNCGFPEPGINLEAVRVIRSFSQQIGARFRFGVLIGGGIMMAESKDAPFMRKTIARLGEAFAGIARDIQSDGLEPVANVEVAAKFPRRLYLFMGNLSWPAAARKNGLKRADLYRTPYR